MQKFYAPIAASAALFLIVVLIVAYFNLINTGNPTAINQEPPMVEPEGPTKVEPYKPENLALNHRERNKNRLIEDWEWSYRNTNCDKSGCSDIVEPETYATYYRGTRTTVVYTATVYEAVQLSLNDMERNLNDRNWRPIVPIVYLVTQPITTPVVTPTSGPVVTPAPTLEPLPPVVEPNPTRQPVDPIAVTPTPVAVGIADTSGPTVIFLLVFIYMLVKVRKNKR